MRKLQAFSLVGALAVVVVGLTSEPGEARHRHRHHHGGTSIELLFGTPYYYPDYYLVPAYQPPVYRVRPLGYVVDGWGAHVAWCDRRYRSYRASDNSFQPYFGSRQACVSPYMD